jgi:cytochrome d ubiquinol oxidase subunit I
VTEVGRQPWTIYGVMRTAEAVTPAEDVQTTFFVFSALYLGLGIVLVMLLRNLATGAPDMPVNKEPAPQEATYAS